MSDDGSRIPSVRGRVPSWIVSDGGSSPNYCSWRESCQGRERIAQDKARTPQAPREDEHIVSGPNLVAGSGFSNSKDDAT
jgi:hypothetical protein